MVIPPEVVGPEKIPCHRFCAETVRFLRALTCRFLYHFQENPTSSVLPMKHRSRIPEQDGHLRPRLGDFRTGMGGVLSVSQVNRPRFVDALLGDFESKKDDMSANKSTDEVKRDAVAHPG